MSAKDISSIDKNLAVPASISDVDLSMYSVLKAPFSIYGCYRPYEMGCFMRMPDEITAPIGESFVTLGHCSAGARVRFSTTSRHIAIRATYDHIYHCPHMPLTGSAGFDLYLDDPQTGISRYIRTFVPPVDVKEQGGYESVLKFNDEKLRHLTIHFPGYSAVKELWVGISPNAELGEGAPYRNVPPIVYYGSSITQSGCASRPGNSYENVISRNLGIDHLNLGFSGNGLGEASVARYIAKLPMTAFVYDYDHNAPDWEYLQKTHMDFYRIIREENPDLPIIMISKPDFRAPTGYNQSIKRRRVILDTYHYAREQGDENAYFIDGSSFFRGYHSEMTTVDGCHPNDLGFALMAEAIESELRVALTQHLV